MTFLLDAPLFLRGSHFLLFLVFVSQILSLLPFRSLLTFLELKNKHKTNFLLEIFILVLKKLTLTPTLSEVIRDN